MPRVITMAVRTMACGRGSLIAAGSVSPTMGASPAAPDETMNTRLTPLLTMITPSRTRLRLRSSSRYTPAEMRTATTAMRTTLAVMALPFLLLSRDDFVDLLGRDCFLDVLADLPVDGRPQAAKDVEDEADHDQVHTDVKEERRHQ